MFDAQMEDDNPTALLWFQKAVSPSKQQMLIAMISATENPTVTMASDMLRRLDLTQKDGKKYCTYCKTNTHNSNECRSTSHVRSSSSNETKVKGNGKKRPLSDNIDLSKIRCYKCNKRKVSIRKRNPFLQFLNIDFIIGK